MAVQETQSEAVLSTVATVETLGAFFATTGTTNPAYLVVDALDRNEYTVAGSGETGCFTGNGYTLPLASIGADGRGAGIVFTWQASTQQYVNATYGNFSALDFTTSTSQNDVANISVFTTSSVGLAQADANNAYALIQADAAGYVGSVTFAADPLFAGTPPAQATPDGIAAAALRFVGDAWNSQGCWVLASTIAAEAGAGLPVQSTELAVPGKPNGEWTVIYNGPAGKTGNWQSMVTTGDMVVFSTPGGGGHITTCVAGSGTTAMLVDNATFETANGTVTNAANDGSSNDILIGAAHSASQEWLGVAANAVVIYALDTPLITDRVAGANVSGGGTLALAPLFAVFDPAAKAITQFQIYDTNTGDSLLAAGVAAAAHSAATALDVTSLAGVSLLAQSGATTDTIDIRAFNGTYYGDWQPLAVTVTPPQPPVLVSQTGNQTWRQGAKVSFGLPGALFRDPQGQALTYSANLSGGWALPGWLSFNAATHVFSGTVPVGVENFVIVVTATDTGGLASSENFAVTVPAVPPVLALHTATQNWAANGAVNFALPSGTFVDPQGEAMNYAASLANGAPLPGWLQFNAASESFSGTAPGSAQSMQIKVTATDGSGLSAYETFAASIVKSTGHLMTLADWGGAPAMAAAAVLRLEGGAVLPVFEAEHGIILLAH